MVMENPRKKTFLESHGKVIENSLEIKSYEILLRAEKNFFKLLVMSAVAQSVLIPYFIDI